MTPELPSRSFPLFTPGDPLYDRPSLIRLFCAVENIRKDSEGKAKQADVLYLDFVEGRVQWLQWDVGHVLHMHPFKLRLDSTARAGLHINSECRTQSGDMRYASNFMVREEGIFVLNPSNVLSAGEKLEDAVRFRPEANLVEAALTKKFGLIGGRSAMIGLLATRGARPPEPTRYFQTC